MVGSDAEFGVHAQGRCVARADRLDHGRDEAVDLLWGASDEARRLERAVEVDLREERIGAEPRDEIVRLPVSLPS